MPQLLVIVSFLATSGAPTPLVSTQLLSSAAACDAARLSVLRAVDRASISNTTASGRLTGGVAANGRVAVTASCVALPE